MAGAKIQHYRQFSNGVVFPVRNAESSNYSITNYGNLIKMLLPREMVFEGMYLEPERLFEEFNKTYNDIFQSEFGNDKPAWQNLIEQINTIKKTNTYDAHQKLNTVLARCFELNVSHDLQPGNEEFMRKKLAAFRSYCLTSKDKNIRDNLPHMQIFNGVEQSIIRI